MCGRFSQAYSWDEIVAFSQPLTVPAERPNLRARYNISPTTEVDIIVRTEAATPQPETDPPAQGDLF